jgi:hypothetical protein
MAPFPKSTIRNSFHHDDVVVFCCVHSLLNKCLKHTPRPPCSYQLPQDCTSHASRPVGIVMAETCMNAHTELSVRATLHVWLHIILTWVCLISVTRSQCVSASRVGDREFYPRSGHTKDHHKNAVWQGTLQYTDMSRESNSRSYQFTSPRAPAVSISRNRREAEG